MAILKPYNKEMLESWKPGRVCCLYMNAFMIKQSHSENDELEKLASDLSYISFTKRLEVRGVLKEELAKRVKTEDFRSAAEFRDMLKYYEKHVMG